MTVGGRSIMRMVLSWFGIKNRTNTHRETRPLSKDEAHILQLIQQMYGDRNQPSECFRTDSGNIMIFVKDNTGQIPIAVNLSIVADIAKEGNLSDQDIQDQWLKPQ